MLFQRTNPPPIDELIPVGLMSILSALMRQTSDHVMDGVVTVVAAATVDGADVKVEIIGDKRVVVNNSTFLQIPHLCYAFFRRFFHSYTVLPPCSTTIPLSL